MRCLKAVEFGGGNGECALGGEKGDKIVTDEEEEEMVSGISVSCVGVGVFIYFFLTERCAL